ncbi:MAG: hemerythrin domain-containing protein [Deltaproteobacteria bacterium]|nr:hemerythrin domain-containing protein [Deltaproteobacteria bacterium]
MNAIDLLESQHREVEKLFSRIEAAKGPSAKQKLFDIIADKLAVHATIEEHQFYPAVKAKRTEDVLLESLEEHVGIKRVLADLLKTPAGDETFDAKIKVLKEQVEHHVEEEEEELFPKVRKLLDEEHLEALGQEMSAEQSDLETAGTPRNDIPSQTGQAAEL